MSKHGSKLSDQRSPVVPLDTQRRTRLMEAIVKATPDLVYAFDLNHRFIFANDALLAMWGKTWDEAIGKTCFELGYEAWHAEMHGREIEHVIAAGQPIRGEVPFTGTNGRRIYDYIFVPVFNDSGQVEAIAGTTRDVTERHEQEKHRELLSNELQHRVKNTLTVVQAISRQSFGTTPAYTDFAMRLQALAGGLDMLTHHSWVAARLPDLLQKVLSPHQPADTGRIRYQGPNLLVRARSVVALSLAISELATNATKYGSLSNAVGTVDVQWTMDGNRFHLVWCERGGPPVEKPTRAGFGSRLIKSLATELSGKVELDHRPGGLVCEITASSEVITESGLEALRTID